MLERLWKRYLRRSGYSPWHLLTPFMWLLSLCYGLGLRLHRTFTKDKVSLSLPVISIGNVVVGGSGKTPLTALLAAELTARRMRVGIVSSGYGRQSGERFVGDAQAVLMAGAQSTGDETRLLALSVPEARFAVDKVKANAAVRLAESGHVDVIIIDDGFQHHRLNRDIDIVLYDAAMPKPLLHLLPWGRLREPLTALSRADVTILVNASLESKSSKISDQMPVGITLLQKYAAEFTSKELAGRDQRFPVTYMKDKTVFLFAGIATFEPFHYRVAQMCGKIGGWLELADHQEYGPALLSRIKSLAHAAQADLLLTTGKDWVKLGSFDFGLPCYYLDYRMNLGPDQAAFVDWICDRLKRRI